MIKYMLLIFVLENGQPAFVPMEPVLVYKNETDCMDAAAKLYFNTETPFQGACTPYIDREQGTDS